MKKSVLLAAACLSPPAWSQSTAHLVSGIDATGFDTSMRVQEDFYGHSAVSAPCRAIQREDAAILQVKPDFYKAFGIEPGDKMYLPPEQRVIMWSVAPLSTMNTLADMPTPPIVGYHAHIYFAQDTVVQARALCEAAAQRFDVAMGRVHERPVGPHPDWSCQLAFKPAVFAELIPWLAMHRGGLVVFVHPISDNEVLDHTDRAMWMGAVRPLDLSVLSTGPGSPD